MGYTIDILPFKKEIIKWIRLIVKEEINKKKRVRSNQMKGGQKNGNVKRIRKELHTKAN